jgi:6-phosphogluconolactonase/glucosamine-6-phosphate isomerase/deaminase
MAITFIKSADSSPGEIELIKKITLALYKKQRVLWIISGGSNLEIATRIMFELNEDLTSNLQIILSDERYVKVGNKDSNYASLMEAGFDSKLSTFESILSNKLDPQQTVERYRQLYETKLAWADLTVAQLGIGEDGHIAGVLPRSPAINSKDKIVYYEGVKPFKRLSLSLDELAKLHSADIFCFGLNKRI